MTIKLSASLASLMVLTPFATAQQNIYGQCGGIGWTGATTCVEGTSCSVLNSYYSQCLPTASGTTIPASVSSASPTSSAPTPTTTAKLNAAAQAAGKTYFGSATDNPELTDAPYVAILSDNQMFGQLTPGNSMKWDATEPEQGVFTFAGGDAIVALAQQNGQLVRGHNCVWYNQLPSWVTSGNFTAPELTSIIQEHCGTLVGHYKGDIYSWDIINEPFNDDGTWRSDVWYDTLNTTFVPIALQAARAADPGAKLYINDYNIEGTGAKSTAMVNLVKQLQADNVPIDGIGVQGHLIVGEVPTTLQENLEQFTALGVEVAITELDIRMTLPATDALLAQQQQDYQTVISACQAVKGCIGITVWDYTDKYSWVPSTFPGQGEACPWDLNLVPKPAFSGILAGF